MPGKVRFSQVRKMLEAKGYRLARIHGSHRIFTKAGARSVPIPVHKGKVKPAYARLVRKLEAWHDPTRNGTERLEGAV